MRQKGERMTDRFHRILLAFKIYYMLYLLLAFNAFVNGSKWMNYASYFTAAAGLCLLLWMIPRAGRYLKVDNCILLLLFIASWIFSSIMNLQYGYMENLQGIIWLVLQVGILYLSCSEYTIRDIKEEFKILAVTYLIYCTVANSISLSMLQWGYMYEYKDPQNVIHAIGFRWGRLWGIYDDPNHGAVISLIAVFLGIYLLELTKKKIFKVFLIFGIAVQYLYILFSDSRTGLLALVAGIFLWCLDKGMRRKRPMAMLKKSVLSIGIAAILAGAVYGTAYGGKQIYNVYEKQIYAKVQGDKQHQLGRKEDLAQDASNGRMDIWKSGLEIFEKSPVWGVSYRNMTAYVEKQIPDSYLVRNTRNVKYDSMHDMPMDVLVSQGIIGILLLCALAANTMRIFVKYFGRVQQEGIPLVRMLVVIIAALGVASLLLSMIFYVHTPGTYCFWLCLGYLIRIFALTKNGEWKGADTTVNEENTCGISD